MYINPNINLFPSLFYSSFDVFLFGPGYNSRSELEEGIYKFHEKNGPFDIIVADGTMLFWDEKDILNPFSTGFNYFDLDLLPKIFKEIKLFYVMLVHQKY